MKEGGGAAPGRHPVLLHTGVAVLSLMLVSLAFFPADLPLMAWVGFVPWMAWHARRPRPGTARALVSAFFVHHVYLLWWTGETNVALAFMIPVLGIIPALAQAWLADWTVHRLRLPVVLAYPLVFISVELARDELLTVSWTSTGYSQWRWLELVQAASLGGIHLVSFLVLTANAALAAVVVHLRRSPVRALAASGWALLLLGAAHAHGAWALDAVRLEPGPMAVGLQPDVPVYEKLKKRRARTWRIFRELKERHGVKDLDPDLLVLPETSFFPSREPGSPMEAVLRTPHPALGGARPGDLFPRGRGQQAVVGYNRYRRIPRGSEGDADRNGYKEWNVAGVVENGFRVVAEYAKREIVPFGEFVPLPRGFPGRRWLERRIHHDAGYVPDLTAGREPVVVPLRLPGGRVVRYGLTICYEMVFPGYFREAAREGADFVVNISNDGWYRESAELDLVHAAARFRAVEVRRSLLRVSNTGISTLVDPLGRYLDTVEGPGGSRKSVSGVVAGRVPLAGGTPPYAAYGAWPCTVLPLGLVLLCAAALRGRRRGTPCTSTRPGAGSPRAS